MPSCEPYVLTHCDLNLGNIIINEGLTGLLGWEYSAYCTIWHEYVSASCRWTEDDAEWEKLLQKRLECHGDRHGDAKTFWKELRLLKKYLHLDEKGRKIIERLRVDE